MKHLAIIADGNRRWAKNNALLPKLGHAQGLVCIERVCDWAITNKLEALTFFCFSTENWNRSKEEIANLMELARDYFISASSWYIENGIRVRFSGRRDRLPEDLVLDMEKLEDDTKPGTNLNLIICIDYGGRDEIVRAIAAGAKTEDELTAAICGPLPCPDVILRTGGYQRLSNFMLWQCAYAELMFTDTLFPDLDAEELDLVLKRFYDIQRNFGG